MTKTFWCIFYWFTVYIVSKLSRHLFEVIKPRMLQWKKFFKEVQQNAAVIAVSVCVDCGGWSGVR